LIEQTLLNIEKDMQRVKIMGYTKAIIKPMEETLMERLEEDFMEEHYEDIEIGILN
jgi:hypothetical protein